MNSYLGHFPYLLPIAILIWTCTFGGHRTSFASASAVLKGLNTENQWKYIQFDSADGSPGHGHTQGGPHAARSRFGYQHALPSGYQAPQEVYSGASTSEFVRPARQLNLGPNSHSIASNSLNSVGLSISDYGSGGGGGTSGYGSSDLEFGGYAAAGSHGGGGYGGGGGGGYGHGKKDCNSALGLLGVLGLMSFLQSVLSQLTSTAAPPTGRRRRDVDESAKADNGDDMEDEPFAFITETDTSKGPGRSPRSKRSATAAADANVNINIDQVTLHILPYLIRLGQIVDSVAPLNCSLHAICTVNHILSTELEPTQGQVIGRMMSNGILNMLTQKYDPKGSNKGLDVAEIANAAIVGRSAQGECGKRYQECDGVPETSLPGFISLHSTM